MSDFMGLSGVLAMLEMKKPIRKEIQKQFLKLKKYQVVFLGALSGVLFPLTLCLPVLAYLAVGALYSIVFESVVPGVTGFQGENFLGIFAYNISFFGNIVAFIIKYMALPSLIVAVPEIVIRHHVFINPKQSVWKTIYEKSLISIVAFYVLFVILTFPSRDYLFGIAGILVIVALPAYIVGLLYRCILFLTMDYLLKLCVRLKKWTRQTFRTAKTRD
ncbi:MAG: hypothetical protein PHD88_00650 [Firmicutes bacterium]|nr:hypothetical protein [Bacillota bacterium]MDD4692903.1 hypothetical protein [Bacillota bacterium]